MLNIKRLASALLAICLASFAEALLQPHHILMTATAPRYKSRGSTKASGGPPTSRCARA